MRTSLVLMIFSCIALSNQQTSDAFAKILKYNSDNDGFGSYKFEYETENGIRHAEEGKLKEAAIAASGNYEYTAPNGEIISVAYTADENGYKPKVIIYFTPPANFRISSNLVASLVGSG